MIKQHKWKLLISSILILLPCLFGAIVWDRLPSQMATHWGADGEANGWSGKLFAVLGLPLILLALHWICLLITMHDNRSTGQPKKAFGIVFWLLPVISLYVNGMIYAGALGLPLNMSALLFVLLGIGFTVIGNYLPKTKQNRTYGIKLPWTLTNEENWNKTHRFAGRLWVIVGLLCFPASFLPLKAFPFVFVPLLLSVVIAPCLYSYILHKKQNQRDS